MADAERDLPTWRFPTFDVVAFGVEIGTAEGRCFAVTWDAPGRTEGISLREARLVDLAVLPGADVARG